MEVGREGLVVFVASELDGGGMESPHETRLEVWSLVFWGACCFLRHRLYIESDGVIVGRFWEYNLLQALIVGFSGLSTSSCFSIGNYRHLVPR